MKELNAKLVPESYLKNLTPVAVFRGRGFADAVMRRIRPVRGAGFMRVLQSLPGERVHVWPISPREARAVESMLDRLKSIPRGFRRTAN